MENLLWEKIMNETIETILVLCFLSVIYIIPAIVATFVGIDITHVMLIHLIWTAILVMIPVFYHPTN